MSGTQEKSEPLCTVRCRACKYSFQANFGDGKGMARSCEFLLKAGRKRPCLPGDECTEFKPAPRRKYSAWYKEVKP